MDNLSAQYSLNDFLSGLLYFLIKCQEETYYCTVKEREPYCSTPVSTFSSLNE